ncbi:hypothetical protein CJU89_0684 [Yarrowia sp. B02]|nr:hypothetical protein CJU89_0684 [Yarrowia sp. B02]
MSNTEVQHIDDAISRRMDQMLDRAKPAPKPKPVQDGPIRATAEDLKKKSFWTQERCCKLYVPAFQEHDNVSVIIKGAGPLFKMAEPFLEWVEAYRKWERADLLADPTVSEEEKQDLLDPNSNTSWAAIDKLTAVTRFVKQRNPRVGVDADEKQRAAVLLLFADVELVG